MCRPRVLCTMYSPSPHPLSPALRAVLASPLKFALLRQLEQLGEASSKELAAAMAPPLKHNTVNLHLKQLEELGWILVAGHEQRRGAFARRWVTTTAPGAWEAFSASIAAAPEPFTRAA